MKPVYTRPLSMFIALMLVSTLLACSPLTFLNAISPEHEIVIVKDIEYGSDERQRLDLYRPSHSKKDLPTVLFLYGGSWKRGEREQYAFAANAIANEGFVVAVADYRVYPEVTFPAFVYDGAKAISWLSKNVGRYGGKQTDIHLMGHSAGAHIAALLALDETYLKSQSLSRDILGRWVGLSGPYAFYPSKVSYVRDIFAGLSNEDDARPITFASHPGAPEALLLHGGDDTVVLPENSQRLADALMSSGTNAKAIIYPDLGHATLVATLSDTLDGIAPTLKDSVLFLKTGRFPE